MKCKRGLAPNPILTRLIDAVSKFKDLVPIVMALRNENLDPKKHIEEIREVIENPDFALDDELTLNDLLDMNIDKFMVDIQKISTQATQEVILKK